MPEVLRWSLQQAQQASLQALIACVDAFGGEDWSGELAGIARPTLILHGTADKPVPYPLTALRTAAGVRGATLRAYEGSSHGLLVTERDRVTAGLLAFLRG